MAEALVIVESPAKAKTIGKYLGSKYKVIASNGHIRDLPKSQLGVDVEHGFAPKYITLRGRGDVLENIRREAKEAKTIYLATDPDREGEAISWHLAEILKLDPGSKCRIEFNEITSAAVKGSLKKVRSINMDLVDAQQARRVLDRLVGYKISPILWAKVRKGLSAGRVQSVATRIICDREEEINDFVPQEYWVITALLGEKKGFEARFYSMDGKKELTCKEEADAVLAAIEGKPFVVAERKVAEKKRHAAPPFTTSSLQQEASRKLNFIAKKTMLIAQKLYEGLEIGKKGPVGLISYIRTDSVRVAKEAQDAAREHILTHYGPEYLPETPNVYKGRKEAQDAHEAIRPTDLKNDPKELKAYLSNDEYMLYKLIYDRFLASQMGDMVYEATSVSFDCGRVQFRANGNRTLFPGFTAVYTEGRDDQQETVGQLPLMEPGDSFIPRKIDCDQRFTQPPARFTEATLVKALEEKGIGRPSTYAPTISTIVDRGYVLREKKTLMPTELGFVVTRLMKENFADIVDVAFTAGMEEKLDQVEEGKAQWQKVIADFYGPFEKTLEKAESTIEKVKLEDPVSDVPCDLCGAMMVIKDGRFGKFLACPNFPKCRCTKAILEKLDVPCPKCGGELIKRRTKKGKVFYGCSHYPECDFVSWDKPVNKKCPKCGKLLVQRMGRNGPFIACPDRECGYILRSGKKSEEKTADTAEE